MQNLLFNLNMLLAQTPQEKKLTFLYVGLFALLCLLLWMDTRERKAIVGGNKLLAKIIIFMLFISLLAMAVIYFVL